MICKDCQSGMSADSIPVELFRIGRYAVWRYETAYTCVECETDRVQYHEQRIFDAGTEHGWDEACRSRNGLLER